MSARAPMSDDRRSLTPDEKITVAYFHIVRGIAQHDLAALMNVNPGRISEAVSAVRDAVEFRRSRRDEKAAQSSTHALASSASAG